MRLSMNKVMIFFLGFMAFHSITAANPDSLITGLKQASDLEKADILIQLADYYQVLDTEQSLEYTEQVQILLSFREADTLKARQLNEIGRLFLAGNNIQASLRNYEEAERIYLELGEEKKAKLVLFSIALLKQNHLQLPEAARNDYLDILAFSGHHPELNWNGNIRLNLGNCYTSLDLYQDAINQFQLFFAEYPEPSDHENYLTVLLNTGVNYYYLGEYDKSLSFYEQALELAWKQGNEELTAKIYNNIAVIYKSRGEYEKALDYLGKSLEIKLRNNEAGGISNSYMNMGIIYNDWKKHELALDYYLKALAISRELQDQKSISTLMNNLGNVYFDMGEIDIALQYYNQSLAYKTQANDKFGIANTLKNLGHLFISGKNDIEQGLEYLRDSYRLSDEIGDKSGIASASYYLGDAYRRQGLYENALSEVRYSLKISEEENIREQVIINYLLLSDLYEAIGKMDSALFYYKAYSELQEDIFSRESDERLARAQAEFESDKKEQEIELLKKDVQIQRSHRQTMIVLLALALMLILLIIYRYRVKARTHRILGEAYQQVQKREQELEKLNSAKNKLFSIISHDLKNGFASLQAGAYLLTDDLDSLEQRQMKIYSLELKQAIENLYRFMQNLLNWALLQTRHIEYHPVIFDLRDLVEDSLVLLAKAAEKKQISFELEIEPGIRVKADKAMISSVCNNLISNAIKFSYSGGRIIISAGIREDLVEVKIRDSGTGIASENIHKLFRIDEHYQRLGTDSEKGTGLGLILCREFIETNLGKITVESEPGEGTTVTFTLPSA